MNHVKLPRLMVAPNGARRTKADHPALPVTIPEIVDTAAACHDAGADGIHVHVRNSDGGHVLDAGLYLEVLGELAIRAPDMQAQITTEAVGIYTAAQQMALVKALKPASVSISIAELMTHQRRDEVVAFYQWCAENGVRVQHILYGPDDLATLDAHASQLNLRQAPPQLLFVLGRYSVGQKSDPSDLDPFHDWLTSRDWAADWAVCAFGKAETDCLLRALKLGGKARVGFENSLWNRYGSVAESNAERVAEIATLARTL